MPRNLPIKNHVFHLRPRANIVHHHVAAAPSFPIDHDPDVGHIPAQIPRDQIAGRIIFRPIGDGQRFSSALKKHHQIRNPPMVDIRVRMRQQPPPLIRISRKILHHILVNFLLQVDPHRPVRPNNLVRANSGIRRNVAARVRNANIFRNVAHRMMRSLNGRRNQPPRKFLPRNRRRRLRGCQTAPCTSENQHDSLRYRETSHGPIVTSAPRRKIDTAAPDDPSHGAKIIRFVFSAFLSFISV
jgi:hypothetical protein